MAYLKRYFISKLKHSESAKVLFQYLFLTLASVIAGMFLARHSSLSFLGEQASRHFSLPFRYCSSFREVFFEFCHYFLADFICIIFLICSSFSLLNCLVSDLILTFLGLRLGISISAAFSLHKSSPYGETWGLFLLRLGVTLCFIVCAYHVSRCSYAFRSNLTSGRISLSPKHTMILFGIFFFLTSAILLFHILYCGFIFLI